MSSAEVTRHFWEGAQARSDISVLRSNILPAQRRVLDHAVYKQLETIEDLITFTEYHVFAVWDFMSLLKALQREFTCVDLPWLPTASPLARRLINEIVLIEETDAFGSGYLSHFELYLAAMEDLGSNTQPIRHFIDLLSRGVPVPDALVRAEAPAAAASFVLNTWDVVTSSPIHSIAAAFALTREDLIPEMFERVLTSDALEAGRLDRFVDYLRRHIQVDAEEHTPMAMELLVELCGTDPVKWNDCTVIAERCFDARADLWTGVIDSLQSSPSGESSTDQICIRIELPGAARAADLELTLADNTLSVRNRRTGDGCDLSLSNGLRPSDLQASFAFGTLEVRAPAQTPVERRHAHVVPVTDECETPSV